MSLGNLDMRGSPTPPRSGDSFVDARAVLTSREGMAKMAITEARGSARIALDDDCGEDGCDAALKQLEGLF